MLRFFWRRLTLRSPRSRTLLGMRIRCISVVSFIRRRGSRRQSIGRHIAVSCLIIHESIKSNTFLFRAVDRDGGRQFFFYFGDINCRLGSSFYTFGDLNCWLGSRKQGISFLNCRTRKWLTVFSLLFVFSTAGSTVQNMNNFIRTVGQESG